MVIHLSSNSKCFLSLLPYTLYILGPCGGSINTYFYTKYDLQIVEKPWPTPKTQTISHHHFVTKRGSGQRLKS